MTDDVCRGSVLSVPLSDPAQRDIDPLELYASAIDASDYVAALAPLIRQAVPEVGHLLDARRVDPVISLHDLAVRAV